MGSFEGELNESLHAEIRKLVEMIELLETEPVSPKRDDALELLQREHGRAILALAESTGEVPAES